MAVYSFPILFRYTELAALIAFWLVAVSDGCNYKSDCEVNQVCCSYNCINGSSCVGRCCLSDSECSSWESCCSQSCVSGSNWVGQNCSSDTDCSSDEICCYGICQYSYDCYDDDDAPVIAGLVIGSLVFVCMFSMCIFYLLRRRRTFRHRGVMVGQGATVTTTGVMESNPPHPGQFPLSYSYQQGDPYYPPPQYEQQQHTTNPAPPYNPGTAAASEPPPPYTAAPQAASRGLCAPKPSYGAVQSGPNININVNE